MEDKLVQCYVLCAKFLTRIYQDHWQDSFKFKTGNENVRHAHSTNRQSQKPTRINQFYSNIINECSKLVQKE